MNILKPLFVWSLGLAVVHPSLASAAVTLVTSDYASVGHNAGLTPTTVTVSLANLAAGDAIVACGVTNSGPRTMSFADNRGNTYAPC
jgi:hypothetical protein